MHVIEGNRINCVHEIVEWCKDHFATRDTKYNKHYFLEVKATSIKFIYLFDIIYVCVYIFL